MYESLKPLYPAGPCNRTDPIVRHDSPYKGGAIVKIYEPQNDEETTKNNPNENFDNLAVDAVHVPVVKLNNIVLNSTQIEYFKLSSTGLVPSLIISVKDNNGMIEFSDVPGYDNVISVAMIIPVDGVYKKISLDFYIVSCKFFGNSVTYMATFKCMPLEKTHLEQITFHIPTGCQAKWCQLPATDKPTTYKLLHCIAHDCGLGFAATQQTKEVKDYNYRLIHSQKFIDVIREHTAFGGLDENSIFDSWIDVWGNIVLVNVPWIFSETVTPDELATVASYGTRQTNTAEFKDSYHTAGLVHRMLKNFKYPEAPVQMTAAKLKTNYNINPQLDAIREQNYNFDSSVDNNTGSSQVALARKQRNRLNRLAATNELYAQKENYQNEMINRDRLNQQGVTNQNIQAYNAWKQGKTAFENNIAEKRSENYIAGLQNLNSGVQDMLSRQEQRKHDNNTIKAMLAANPNVKPELFNYYGLNLYRFGGCKRNK